ncbi:hypothetical protein D3C77_622970 [compost metagenome]
MFCRSTIALDTQRLGACGFKFTACAHQVELAGIAVVVTMLDQAIGVVAQFQGAPIDIQLGVQFADQEVMFGHIGLQGQQH